MRKKQYMILLCIALLFIVISLFLSLYLSSPPQLLSVIIRLNDVEHTISCWENGEDQIYVFLPSGVSLKNVYLINLTHADIVVDGQIVEENFACSDFSLDVPYNMKYTFLGKKIHKSLIFLQSCGVSSMLIYTESGDVRYLHNNKEKKENAEIHLFNSDGLLDYQGVEASISGRGNYTWTFNDKKPYSVTLSGESDLLDMGVASEWILLANATDPTHLRNKIVYEFAESIGLAYSPTSQWVSLYMNGEYLGLYLLCERNEVHENRVDIEHEDSFLVSMELEARLKSQKRSYVKTDSEVALRIHYPNDASLQQQLEILNVWQSIENAITAENSVDPVTGKYLLDMIDLNSWAKKYLLEEIFGSIDAGKLSQYFYYDGNQTTGKIYAGPVWDFDHSIGNNNEWQLVMPNALFSQRETIEPNGSTPWYYCLAQKKEFYEEVVRLYEEVCLPQLNQLNDGGIDKYADEIGLAVYQDMCRWYGNTKDFSIEVENLRLYLLERVEFLNRMWIDGEDYFVIKALRGNSGYYCYYVVFEGDTYVKLPVLANTGRENFLGWYYKDSNEPVMESDTITENVEIYAKIEPNFKQKVIDAIKVAPMLAIVVLGTILLTAELRRWRKYR